MARIGILTCSNCTQDLNCAAMVCLGDMRKRRGFFERYPKDEPLDLVGLINCSGCPTLAAPEKITKRLGAFAVAKIDALHLSYCLTALCPFMGHYEKAIKAAFPDLEIVRGTHLAPDPAEFRQAVKGLLCPVQGRTPDMNDHINRPRSK
ncbi:MAG: CGGC domain-containing protein [Desulfarculus sp.]|nr:CGGC domain-containing protein [Desulfarculus sp.]